MPANSGTAGRRLLFISDTHFTRERGAENTVWLNRAILNRWEAVKDRLVREIKALRPDAIIHCGDFTQFGTADDYKFGKSIMDATGIAWHAVPGNHDALAGGAAKNAMRRERGIAERDGCFCRSMAFGAAAVALLDVCAPGEGANFAADSRALDWLARLLEENRGRPVFLASHHPVSNKASVARYGTILGSDGLDGGRLASGPVRGRDFDRALGKIENAGKLKRLLERSGCTAIAFSGHWHINAFHASNGVYYRTVPSVCEYPCEAVIADFDARGARVRSAPLSSLGLREESLIAERRNAWAEGARRARDVFVPFGRA
ncbi:MAG: metallophosphoesterase [Clostridiales bacterium]|jgi:3',5'-cyclic AMP phosphodiesterase CpdA|nr:metallophosphoesterase [Clostridiales bacterium]